MFSSLEGGHGPDGGGEWAGVMERDGNRLIAEFLSREGKRLHRTVEEVNLFPPERITFRHLQGPLHHAREEFRLLEVAEGTHVTYRGQIECRMPFLPGNGWLVARWHVRPKYLRVVKRRMAQVKETAEGGLTLL